MRDNYSRDGERDELAFTVGERLHSKMQQSNLGPETSISMVLYPLARMHRVPAAVKGQGCKFLTP